MKHAFRLLLTFWFLTGPASSAPQQNLGNTRSAGSQGFIFKLWQCGRVGDGVACDFWITNEGDEDRELYLFWHDSRMVGDDGKEYKASSIEFEGARRVYVNNGVATRGKVVPNISFYGKIRFDNASPSINTIALVQLLGRVFEYRIDATFRDISLTGASRRGIPSYPPSNNPGMFSPPTYPYQRREKTFTLSRLNIWLNTHIEVSPGMRVVISSNGTINVRNVRSVSPDPTGIGLVIEKTWPRNSKLRERTVRAGDVALKVVYPDGGESRAVTAGRSRYEFKPRQKGILALGIPQDYTGDTNGSISILVQW